MPSTPAFAEFVQELLGELGELRFKRMFGGYGVYRHDTIFALIINDTLYLKGYPDNVAAFEAAGAAPFQYAARGGKLHTMNYWRLPETALDDPDEAVAWARLSLR